MPRGIVLTNGTPAAGMVFHMALVFETSYKYVRQFKLMPVATTRMKTIKIKSAFTKSGTAETERMVEDTLIYGEVLDWEEFDSNGRAVELVQEYKRVQQVYESRLFDGETQLLLQGIMSKNRKVLWMCDIWPDLEIPFRLQQDVHPNVTVNAWITVHIMPNQSLKYELHSFHDTADSFQHLVKKAAWNEGDEGNLMDLYDPFSPNSERNHDLMPQLSETITGMQGMVISKKIVLPIDPKHRDYCFHRIVLRNNDRYPENGTYVRFNAEKLDFLNIYALKDIISLNDGQNMQTTQNGMIKVTIRWQPSLPGFYFSERLQIYIDDPENILETWLLSPYIKSTLQVGITATEPSIRGTPRFAITEITDTKLRKLQKLRNEEDLRLDMEPGIVIDFMGKIHVPRLPKSNFRLPADAVQRRTYPPGTQIFITATLGKRWKIESVEVNVRTPSIPAVELRDPKTKLKTIWFNIPKARGCNELPFLLDTQPFGLIQTPRDYKPRRRPDTFTHENVWIAVNDCHPGEMIRPPAKFKFCGLGRIEQYSEPIEPIAVPKSKSPDYPELSSDLDNDYDSDYPDLSSDLELNNEYALNEYEVPPVYPAIPDEEFERNSGLSVTQMVRRLENNENWIRNPSETIRKEIREHLSQCSTCSEHKFNEKCVFAEYLSYAIRMKPEIAQVVNTDILSMVTIRRFRQ